jgi:hypothetical protein
MKIKQPSKQTLKCSSESIHEASHVIVAAVMGTKEISVIASSGKLRASVVQGTLWGQIVTSFAGYAGDVMISGLPEVTCLARSTTDRTLRETMRADVPPEVNWETLCHDADACARFWVNILELEILEFATELEPFVIAKRDFPAEHVEALMCVKIAREAGRPHDKADQITSNGES